MTNKQYAILGFFAVILFWVTYFIMSNQRPEYSFMTKAISELGSLDAPNKWVWNICGYVIPGVLIAVFGFGLYKNIVREKASKLPLIGIVFSGLFMSLSGVFPGDLDNRESLTMLLHRIGSIGCYVFFLLGAFTYPKQMKKTNYWRRAIKPSLLFTWLTIVFGNWAFVVPEMPGVGQRIVFALYFMWILFAAYRLYRQNDAKNTTHL